LLRFLDDFEGGISMKLTVAASGGKRSRAAGSMTVVLTALGALGLAASAAGRATGNARLYVSDERAGDVVVVDADAGALIARIAVGRRPRGLVLSADGSKLYVALSGSPIGGPNVDESKLPPPDRRFDGIGVVDLRSHRLVNTYPSGPDPETFGMSHDGKTLYVSNEDTGMLTSVDLASGTVRATVAVGKEPEGVAVSHDDRLIYVACETADQVYVVDARTMRVSAKIATLQRPRTILLSRDGRTGYVSDEFGSAITEFNAATQQVLRTIRLGAAQPPVRPMGLAASADGRLLYVTTGRAGALLEIDLATGRLRRSIPDVGKRPWGVVLSDDGHKAYTANGPSGDIAVIDLTAGRVARRIAVGGSPWGIVSSISTAGLKPNAHADEEGAAR
jgi:YVTN family beta-propeller protein